MKKIDYRLVFEIFKPTKKSRDKKEECKLIFDFIPLMILCIDIKNNIIFKNKTAIETLALFDEKNNFFIKYNPQ